MGLKKCHSLKIFLWIFLWGQARSDVLEVGVFEEGGVFEAVAEEAVEGYVGCPDEGDGLEWPGMMGRVADVAGG